MATRKKATKKKVAKKKTAKYAVPQRPTYTATAAASQEMTKTPSLFFDMKEPGTYLMRILPRLDNNPAIYIKSVLHYGFVDPDDPERRIALGCLEHHGTDGTGDDCLLCKVAAWLCAQDDPTLNKMGAGYGSIGAVHVTYIQAWVKDLATTKWHGPHLVKIAAGPKGVAPKLSALLSMAENLNQPVFVDFDDGQAIGITREGTGRNTEWSVQSSGVFGSIDDIDPKWLDKVIKDVPAKLNVKVWSQEDQWDAVMRAYPGLPWDLIGKELS